MTTTQNNSPKYNSSEYFFVRPPLLQNISPRKTIPEHFALKIFPDILPFVFVKKSSRLEFSPNWQLTVTDDGQLVAV